MRSPGIDQSIAAAAGSQPGSTTEPHREQQYRYACRYRPTVRRGFHDCTDSTTVSQRSQYAFGRRIRSMSGAGAPSGHAIT